MKLMLKIAAVFLCLAAPAAAESTINSQPITSGVSDGSSAPAGSVGEIVTATVSSGAAVSLSNNTPGNVASIVLSAGDWDCSGVVDYALTTATVSLMQSGISNTSATFAAQDTYMALPVALTLVSPIIQHLPPNVRMSISSPVTLYLVGQMAFSVGSIKAYGTIRCRRAR